MSEEVIERLTRIETLLETLTGNGQPGRIQLVEADVKELRETRWRWGGIMIGASTVLSLVGTWMYHVLFGGRQ